MKQLGKIIALLLLYLILPLHAAYAETLEDQLNNLVGPKEQYNTMLSPVYLRNNESVESISPQSGELTLTQTDYVLPGRNGLNLEFTRIYKNSGSQVQEMKAKYVKGAWVDYVYSDGNTSSFYEDRYNLGIGMRFSFPSIEVRKNTDGTSHNFLHTDSGDVYRLKKITNDGKGTYAVEGQTVKDVVVKESTEFNNGQSDGISKYVMSGKDGKKTYFASDGRLLGIVDRYGNTIRFEYVDVASVIDGLPIRKKLISKITDTVGRETTIEYKEDASYTVNALGSESYGANESYKASQNPNSVDSGDLQGKFQVIVTLPGNKKLVYDKSAVLVSSSKHVLRTRLQRVYDVDGKVKYHYWYEQPELGFTYFNGAQYSVYNRYENMVQVDYAKTNRIKRYVYNTYTKRLNQGSMQYRKIFEARELVKTGFDPNAAAFTDKFVTTVKDKTLYTYTNEADGYGTAEYQESNDEYLRYTYRYYTELSDMLGNTTKYTYDGINQLILMEKQGRDHREEISSAYDEMKLVKKQESLLYPVANGQTTGEPVKKIENFRYDEYGNMTNYTGPEAERNEQGYPVNTERTVIYAYAYDKFHVLSQKTWKIDQERTAQTIYSIDDKGNIVKETKVNNGDDAVTEYGYDSYGNMIRKAVLDEAQTFETHYEYGTDAAGMDVSGAYLTKEYGVLNERQIAKTYAYDWNSGQMTVEIDPRGNKTTHEYDIVGRLVKSTLPDGSTKEFTYEEAPYANMKVQYTDLEKVTFNNEYDTKGDLLKASVLVDGDWHVLKTLEYDAKGNKIKETDSNGHSTRFTYDSNYRVVQKTRMEKDTVDKGSISIQYIFLQDSSTPLKLTLTDEEGYVRNMYFDLSDRLRKVEVTPDKTVWYTNTYTYDYTGNKTSETDGRGNTSSNSYDLLGRLTLSRDALGHETGYQYNAQNQATLQIEPGSKETDNVYDALGRVSVKKIRKTGSADYLYTSYSYDDAGNVAELKQGQMIGGQDQLASDVSYTYDNRNLVEEEKARIDDTRTGAISYTYDRNGRKTKAVYYADTAETQYRMFTYAYDYAGRSLEETGAYFEPQGIQSAYGTQYKRDDEGNVLEARVLSGDTYATKASYSYNERNLTVDKSEPFRSDGAMKQTHYQYDKKGNRITETLQVQGADQSTTYTYDGLGKIIRKTNPLGNTTRYKYDEAGNRIKEIDPRYASQPEEEAPGTEYEYDALNRLVKAQVYDGSSREVIVYKEYDERGNVAKETDGEGYDAQQPDRSFGTTAEYDVKDRKVKLVSAQTNALNVRNGTTYFNKAFTYDALGNVLTETDGLGNQTTYTYYLNGLLKEKQDPDGLSTGYDYDLSGKAWKRITDRAGHVTTTYQSIFDKPSRITYPDDTEERFVYTSKGELAESYDQEGNGKWMTYDPSGNLTVKKEFIRSDDASSYYKVTRVEYDEVNRMASSETFLKTEDKASGNGTETTAGDRIAYSYDKAGRQTKVSGPGGRETTQVYDRAGNLKTKLRKVEDGYDEVRRYQYDVKNQLTRESLLVRTSDLSAEYLLGAEYDNEYYDRINSSTDYSYTRNGLVKSMTDSQGNITQVEYDYDKHPVKKVEPGKAATVYGYDLNGNLAEEMNAKSVTTRYEYDALNRLIRTIKPVADGASAITRYVYDPMGSLVKQIAPNDYDAAKDTPSLIDTLIGLLFSYDVMNRRTSTVATDGRAVQYVQYNRKGKVIKTVDGTRYTGDMTVSPGTVYEYDGLGNVVGMTDPLGYRTTMDYDVLGNVIKKTNARGFALSYEYNPDGTMAAAIQPDGGVIRYVYDKLGRKTAETDPLGNITTTSYNVFGKEKTIRDAYDNTVESKADRTGNIVSIKDKRDSVTLMKYDGNRRIIEKKLPLELDASGNTVYAIESYAYDSLGNVLKKSLSSSKDKSFIREMTYTYGVNNLPVTVTDNSGAQTKNYYDKNGNLVKVEKQRDEAFYDIEKYAFDGMNRMVQRIRLVDAELLDEAAGYAEATDLQDSEYPGEIRLITGYEYDAIGNRTKEIDPRAYAGDPSNREAYTTTYSYDAMNRVEKVSHIWNGQVVNHKYTYDEVGNKIAERNERGFESRYAYDSMNRVKTITDALDKSISYEYDAAGNKISETNANGYSMWYAYDKLNRLESVTDAYGVIVQKMVYDAAGNIVKKIDAKGYLTGATDDERYGIQNEYDLANRLVRVKDPELAVLKPEAYTTVYEYNPAGQKVKETNALGHASTYEYDAAGHLVKVTDPQGVSVSYGFDKAGNKLYMEDGRGKVTQYGYGSLGVLKEVTNASGHTISYQYDLAANIAVMTDRMGRHTTYKYDNRNFVVEQSVVETSDRIVYAYDEAGNRIAMTDESGTSSYTYDARNGLLRIEKDDAVQIAYTYDAVGNIASVTDKTGATTEYTYDKSSRMETVTHQAKTTTYAYDENGNRASIEYDGGVREEYTYDKNNRLLTLINKKPDGGEISSYRYTYTETGQQKSKTDSFGTTNYEYDEAGRIRKVEAPGKTTIYTYDKAGNRQTLNETYTSEQPSGYTDPNSQVEIKYSVKKSEYVYSNTNELLQLVETMLDAEGKKVLEKTINSLYDENGNEIRQKVSYLRPHNRSMHQVTGGSPQGEDVEAPIDELLEKVSSTFDGFNRLKRMEKVKGGERATVDFVYNGNGLRTRKTAQSSKDGYTEKVTNYLYDSQYVILETDGSDAVQARYIRGIDYIARIDGADKLSYFLYNGHSDVVQTISAAGWVENQYDYDIFGNPTLTVETEYTNAIRYSGEFFDAEVGLYYLRARYYNPYTARFMSEDTYEGQENDPLSLNRYTYCANDPILYMDPTGHDYSYIDDEGRMHVTEEVIDNDSGLNPNIIYDKVTIIGDRTVTIYGLTYAGVVTTEANSNTTIVNGNEGSIGWLHTGDQSVTQVDNYGGIGGITTGVNSSLTINNFGTIHNIFTGYNSKAEINNNSVGRVVSIDTGIGIDSHTVINNSGYIENVLTGDSSQTDIYNELGGYINEINAADQSHLLLSNNGIVDNIYGIKASNIEIRSTGFIDTLVRGVFTDVDIQLYNGSTLKNDLISAPKQQLLFLLSTGQMGYSDEQGLSILRTIVKNNDGTISGAELADLGLGGDDPEGMADLLNTTYRVNRVGYTIAELDWESRPKIEDILYAVTMNFASNPGPRGGAQVEDRLKPLNLSKGMGKGVSEINPKYATAIDNKVTLKEQVELPTWLKETYTDGQYRTVITNESITVYRTFGGKAGEGGAFATTVPAANRITSKIDSALLPEWKNSRQYEAVIEIPKGTELNIGKVEQQMTQTGTVLKGGGDQILLPQNWPKEWIKEIREVPSR